MAAYIRNIAIVDYHSDLLHLLKQRAINTNNCESPLLKQTPNHVIRHTYNDKLYHINVMEDPNEYLFPIIDGIVVSVNCTEGFRLKSTDLIQNAAREGISTVLMIDGLENCLQHSLDHCYLLIRNAVAAAEQLLMHTDINLSPSNGNVCFGSIKQGWAFTIPTIAKLYASKFSIELDKLCNYFWGDHYYHTLKKKWVIGEPHDEHLKHGFSFVLDPIYKIYQVVQSGDKEKLVSIMHSMQVPLTEEDLNTDPDHLFPRVMQKFFPAHNVLLDTITTQLPSPITSQSHRCALLYTGPQDDEYADSIRNCNSQGPLVVYISKLIPTLDAERFSAFARVFSGTLQSGQNVRVVAKNPFSIDFIGIPSGEHLTKVESVSCGNVVCISATKYLDHHQSWTITGEHDIECHPFKPIRLRLQTVHAAVEPQNAADLPKLVEGLKYLSRYDYSFKCTTYETGETCIYSTTPTQIEKIKIEISNHTNIPLKFSSLRYTFNETVTRKQDHVAMAKAPNKLTRCYMLCEPMDEQLVLDIENNIISAEQDENIRADYLKEHYNWNPTQARKIWCFGPDNSGPNMIVDCTKNVQDLNEVKASVVAGFQWMSKEGVLIEENMRGARFNIVDYTTSACAIRRGGGQIIPMTRRCLYACQLLSEPRLVQPVYLMSVICPEYVVGVLYDAILKGNGSVIREERTSIDKIIVQAYIAVQHCVECEQVLRSQFGTLENIDIEYVIDHWEVMQGSPFEDKKVKQLIADIRRQKGLNDEIPPLERFLDKK
jgi:elongation factor 2